jgi:hypothetical protein
LLYNAYTEKRFGEILKPFKPYVDKIHADSGGLQIITRGMSINDSLKNEIYTNQATYADIGMSFDEIPVKIISGTTSKRNDVNNRYFDAENFEEQARITGRNLKDQILKFIELGSDCKAFAIIQGNCFESYYRWSEILLEEVPKELHDRIGGVAMGAAALGTGSLEDIKRAFYVRQLPFEQSPLHLHILGVGSLKRILPFMTFVANGYYDDVKISYDSTTHTMSFDNGLFYMDQTQVNLDRRHHNNYRRAFHLINETLPLSVDFEEFFYIYTHTANKYLEQSFGSWEKYMEVRFGTTCNIIHRFMKDVTSLSNDTKFYNSYIKRKGISNEFSALRKVTTMDDFRHWEREIGRYVDSNPVSSVAKTSLDSLWE